MHVNSPQLLYHTSKLHLLLNRATYIQMKHMFKPLAIVAKIKPGRSGILEVF